jgi:hypothetical protein
MFDLSYEEGECVNAMYATDACAHRICSEPRLLLDCVNNLPSSDHELMLAISPSELLVKNDVDDSLAESAVRTEMSIAPQDLHEFSIGTLASSPLRISFGMKEFKAMLQFAEGCSSPISLHFDHSGRPLTLVADAGDGPIGERVRLECVIATLVDQSAAAEEMFGCADDDFGMGFENQAAPETTQATPMMLDQPEPGGGSFPQSGSGRGAQKPYGSPEFHQPIDQQMPFADASRVPSRAAQPAHGQCPPHSSRDPVATDTPAPTHEHPGRSLPQQQLDRPAGSDNISSFPTGQPAPAALTATGLGQGASAALASGGAEFARSGQPGGLPVSLQPPYDGSDTDNDEDAVGATPPDSPPSKRVQTGFVEQFALPTGP